MHTYTAPHFETSALVTIDTQNDFSLDTAPAQVGGTMDIIPNMVRLLKAFRRNGRLIIHVVRLYRTDGSNADLCRRQLIESGKAIVAPESPGAELVEQLKPDHGGMLDSEKLLAGDVQKIGNNEFAMYKPRWGAFYQTHLEQFLHDHDIDTLVFSGCNFPNCPRSSIYQASERDFRIVLVADAVSQLYERGIREIENIRASVLATGDVIDFMVS